MLRITSGVRSTGRIKVFPMYLHMYVLVHMIRPRMMLTAKRSTTAASNKNRTYSVFCLCIPNLKNRFYKFLFIHVILSLNLIPSRVQQTFQQKQPATADEKSSLRVNVTTIFLRDSSSFLQQRPFLSFSRRPQLDERQQESVTEFRLSARQPNKLSCTSQMLVANVAMYAVQMFNPSVTQLGVKLSDKILRGEELCRLLSPVFLHGSIYDLYK
jgi:hypothetical protein